MLANARVVTSLGAILSAVLWILAGVGPVAAQPLPQQGAASHLGVASCAGSTCHGAVEPFKTSNVLQNEYVTWKTKDKHFKAYEILTTPRSERIAKNLGLPDAKTAKICLDCHADNVAQDKQGRTYQITDGVGCEACHGGASSWLGIHITGGTHQDNLKAGLYPTDEPIARAKLCISCHFGDSTKFVNHRIMGAGHPRMPFELDTFTATQPAHYVVDDDYKKRKGDVSGAKIWAVGQTIQITEVLDAMLDPSRNPPGIFPELIYFDCQACHHPMTNVRWQPRATTGLGPGVVRFNDANILILMAITERLAPEAAKQLRQRLPALHKATTESRDRTLAEAKAIRDITASLIQTFAAHTFTNDDIKALADRVIAGGLSGEFTDYAGAEQATMALDSIITTMRHVGMMDEAKHKRAREALNKCYDATQNEDQYRPGTFTAALQVVRTAIAN